MQRLILTRVPGRFAILLTIGESDPMFLEAEDMSNLEDALGDEYRKMIGEGYDGFHHKYQ